MNVRASVRLVASLCLVAFPSAEVLNVSGSGLSGYSSAPQEAVVEEMPSIWWEICDEYAKVSCVGSARLRLALNELVGVCGDRPGRVIEVLENWLRQGYISPTFFKQTVLCLFEPGEHVPPPHWVVDYARAESLLRAVFPTFPVVVVEGYPLIISSVSGATSLNAPGPMGHSVMAVGWETYAEWAKHFGRIRSDWKAEARSARSESKAKAELLATIKSTVQAGLLQDIAVARATSEIDCQISKDL